MNPTTVAGGDVPISGGFAKKLQRALDFLHARQLQSVSSGVGGEGAYYPYQNQPIISVPLDTHMFILNSSDSHLGDLSHHFIKQVCQVLEARLSRSDVFYNNNSIVIVMKMESSHDGGHDMPLEFKFCGILFAYTLGTKTRSYYVPNDDKLAIPFVEQFKQVGMLQYRLQKHTNQGIFTMELSEPMMVVRRLIDSSNAIYEEYLAGLRPIENDVRSDLDRLYSQYLQVVTDASLLPVGWKCAPMLDDLRDLNRFSFLNCPSSCYRISTWMPVGALNIARLINSEFERLATQLHNEISSNPTQFGASVSILSAYQLLYCATSEQFASAVSPVIELAAPRDMFCYHSIFVYGRGVPVVNEESESSVKLWRDVAFRMQVAATLSPTFKISFVLARDNNDIRPRISGIRRDAF